MVYKITFDDKVIKDLKKIDQSWQKKILAAIKAKLPNNPYLGRKLVGDLSPFYRLRVGDFRVIYQVFDKQLIVTVIKVKHRKEVYINSIK